MAKWKELPPSPEAIVRAALERAASEIVAMRDLEAKLQKAVQALTELVKDCEAEYPPSHGAIKYFCRTTLAELKGEDRDE